MFYRLLFVIAFAVASAASTADFTGRWAGTATNNEGIATPIYLTVSEHDGAVSGQVSQSASGGVALRDAVVAGEDLAFAIGDALGTPTKYALKFVVFGHPLGDRQIALQGKATTATQQSVVELYPVDGEPWGNGGMELRPALIHRVEPEYTEQARRANVQGTVALRVEIEETGLISSAEIPVLRSLGHGLDEAAVKCVRQWRFRPAFRKGYAVKSAASIEIAFRL